MTITTSSPVRRKLPEAAGSRPPLGGGVGVPQGPFLGTLCATDPVKEFRPLVDVEAPVAWDAPLRAGNGLIIGELDGRDSPRMNGCPDWAA